MSNASTNKTTPATSTTAPTAASTQAKPTVTAGDVKVSVGNGPTTPVPTPAPTSSSPGTSSDESDETDKIQYYIIEGKVETFPDVREAEKFLNSPEAPQCTVIYGKVSLVNEWFITTGTIHPFKSLVKAQKFLKDSPLIKDYTMVRGRITVPEVRVSLRG